MSEPEKHHAGSMWRYNDARGVPHLGHFERCSDHGGSDVNYFFRDCETGALAVLSGSLLQGAHTTTEECEGLRQWREIARDWPRA